MKANNGVIIKEQQRRGGAAQARRICAGIAARNGIIVCVAHNIHQRAQQRA